MTSALRTDAVTGGRSVARGLRITVLCGGSYVGGLETMAVAVACGLKRRGHDVRCLLSGWSDGEFERRLKRCDVITETVKLGKLSRSLAPRHVKWTLDALIHLPEARRRVARHLSSFRPDVVLLYNADWGRLLSSVLAGERVVFMVHEIGASSARAVRRFAPLERMIVAFIAVSEYVAERLVSLGAARSRVHVVHNGTPLPASPEGTVATERRPIVAIVGQIGRWKGHDTLIDALALLKASGTEAHVRIVGKGDQEYESQLRRRIDQAALSTVVEFTGFVSSMDERYRDVSICVIPSIEPEAFGLVAVEAAMRAIPVIASRIGALPEVVVDGETGILVEPGDASALADAIASLLQSPTERARLGAAAQRRANQLFDEQTMLDNIEARCAETAAVERSAP